MLIAGGGLNSTISGLKRGDPFHPIEEFKGEYPLHLRGPAQRQRRSVVRARSRSTGRGKLTPTISSV